METDWGLEALFVSPVLLRTAPVSAQREPLIMPWTAVLDRAVPHITLNVLTPGAVNH